MTTNASPWQRSLTARLRRTLLVLALLPLVLGFGISLTSYLISERNQLYDQYQRRAERVNDVIRDNLDHAQAQLMQARRFWNFDRLKPSEQQTILRDILADSEAFNAIDYLSALGERRLRISRLDFGELPALHWREQEAVAQTMASGEKRFSKVERTPGTGEPYLILSLPVHDPASGKMVGILAAEVSLKQVWRKLAQLAQGTTDDVFVVSAEQRVIAHVNLSRVLAGTRYTPPPAVGVARDLNGELALVAVSELKLPGNTLTAVLTRPLTSAFGVGLFQIGLALVIMAISLALALWLIRLMTRWLLDPIAELTRAAERIGADERDVRVQGHFEGEVATLAATFNLMLDRLHHEQDVLEQRVAERTHALAQASEQTQQANRMLHDVLDTIPVRLFWKDRNLVYLGCNQLFARDAGKASPQEVIGKTDQDLLWHDTAHNYQSADRQVINTGRALLGYEVRRHTHGNPDMWSRTYKVPLCSASGEVLGVLGVYEDITEDKRIEAELRSAKDVAENASRAKSLFLSSMSHELRTPLNAILGYAQLLEMNTDLSADVALSAQEIRQAGRHLLALVNDILDLARIEAGRMEFTLDDLALGSVLAECLSQNLPRATEQAVSLEVAPDCHACGVRADHRRLVQVFNNLISNAIKYNRKNGHVTIRCALQSGDLWRISVTDTGPGMSAGQLSQLFQPFNRAGAEMSTVEGTGIGLTITRQLVEGMNGTIGVDSTPGEGSTFWIELPRAEAMASLTALPAAVPAAATPSNTASARPRVLVAEDYAPNQTVLRLQLESLGCEVDIAGDGAVALAQWRAKRHDLILSDLNMPVMDGLTLARSVREDEQANGGHVPIIGITAAAVASELQRCRDAGMDDALTKPIAIEGLRSVIERWIGRAPTVAPTPAPVATPAGNAHAVFDLSTLYRVLGQVNPAQAHELVNAFIESAGQGLAALAHSAGDAQALAREMHKQKSSARTVGALRYATLAEALEQTAHDKSTDAPARLTELREELAAVRTAAQRAQASAPQAAAGEALPRVSCKSVLVVDDDEVVLKQVKSLLSAMGVPEVLVAANGMEAIDVMAQRGGELEVVVCDLNMPEMDGVELIRRFGQTSFKGGLILMSGADAQILSTASRLAELQGLRVLGQVAKPVMPQPMAALLARMQDAVKEPQRQARVMQLVTTEALREAMTRNEFLVWFQPKVDAQSLLPTGLEALARWRRPDGSFVPPDQFITLAEREGLIGELSRILVERALHEAGLLREAGFKLKLAVNLSGLWLDDVQLPDIIASMASRAGIQAKDLVLEVTETGVMEDLTTALDVLTRLRLKGFGLSIDDFGIGYSSFEQLGRIPFTEMKLDRSFVNKGNHDPAARAILESSMGMAQKLGLVTVAEGVETQDELALVRTLGCDNVQGFLIAKPMPVDELIVWLGRTTPQ